MTADRIWTVTEVNRAAKRVLETELGGLWLEGEVYKITYASSGHLYFTVKDDSSALDAVMWRSAVQRLPFRVETGQRILVLGSLTIYDRAGRYQIVAEAIRDAGLGDLQRALEQLKAKLAAEGLFDDDRKRPLPLLPRRVGVVTSATGAAVADIIQTIHRRAPGVPVLLSPARVQGDDAAQDVIRALTRLQTHGGCDVVIVGRGGGSAEDLMAFNDEALVRAVAAFPVPVVSAVGHEVDVALTDFSADRRAKTPTEAGEFVVPNVARLAEELITLRLRATSAVRRYLRDLALAVSDADRRIQAHHPQARLERGRSELDALTGRACQTITIRLGRQRAVVETLMARLDALSPLRVLDRGFALVLKDGEILRETQSVHPGDSIDARLARGTLRATVTSVE